MQIITQTFLRSSKQIKPKHMYTKSTNNSKSTKNKRGRSLFGSIHNRCLHAYKHRITRHIIYHSVYVDIIIVCSVAILALAPNSSPCLPSSPPAPATMAPKAAPPSPAPTELDVAATLADTEPECESAGSVSRGGSGSRSRSPPALVEAPRAAVGGEEQGQEAAPAVQTDLLADIPDPLWDSWLSRAHEEAARNAEALLRGSSPEPRPSGRRPQPLYEVRETGPPGRHGTTHSASGSAGMRWWDLPRTNDDGVEARVAAPGLPLAAEFHDLYMRDLEQARADQRVDRSRFRRCHGGDVESDLGLVSLAVSSLCRDSDAFYIGACVREPEDRFYNVGDERAGPEQSVAHHVRFERMCVLMVGSGAQIGDRETAAIRMYSVGGPYPDVRIRNLTDAASGFARERARVYLYLCYGSAEREYRARTGVFMS